MYHISKSQLTEMLISLLVAIGLMILFHQTSLDETMASLFYSKTGSWFFRDNFILEKIFHKGGVLLIILIMASLVGSILYIYKKRDQRQLRDFLFFILTASVLTIMLVFSMKRSTTLPCPWESAAFGGGHPVPMLWQMFSGSLPKGHCFPAGHSSGGYGLLSIYFGYTYIYGKRNFYMLIPGALIGITFGIIQQMRGAHYVSHDFATILVSITASLITIMIFSNYKKCV